MSARNNREDKLKFANGVDTSVKLSGKMRVCTVCGGNYIPTGRNQKLCPDCRKEMKKNGTISDAFKRYKQACTPGLVTTSKVEIPEQKMAKPETPETPDLGIRKGYEELKKAVELPDGWHEEQKRFQLPDGLAVIEEHAEILRRYYKGELVDKNELLARVCEKIVEC